MKTRIVQSKLGVVLFMAGLFFLSVLSNQAKAHVWEIFVRESNTTATFYAISYHPLTAPTGSLLVDGRSYRFQQGRPYNPGYIAGARKLFGAEECREGVFYRGQIGQPLARRGVLIVTVPFRCDGSYQISTSCENINVCPCEDPDQIPFCSRACLPVTYNRDLLPDLEVSTTGCQFIYNGWTPTSATISAMATGGGGGSYNYLWSNGMTSSSISVSPTETTEYCVTVSDVCGEESSSCSTVEVIDVRCGNNLDKVSVCHRRGNGRSHNICISAEDVQDHLDHGDYVGPCGTVPCAGNALVKNNVDNFDQAAIKDLTISEDASLAITPNPAMEEVNVVADGRIQEILIFNLAGGLVFRQSANSSKVTLDVGNIFRGVYILNVVNEKGEKQVRKLFLK